MSDGLCLSRVPCGTCGFTRSASPSESQAERRPADDQAHRALVRGQLLRKLGFRFVECAANRIAREFRAEVPERIDIVDVFRRAEDAPAIADEAVTIGAKALWLQTGIVSEDAAARAAAGGLAVVMDACIGATHSVLQVPKKA